ncbi:MAG: S-layer homology domain-containing protein, partial [Cyanobacteriota bacterium]
MRIKNIKDKLKSLVISTLSTSLIFSNVFTTAAFALSIDNIAEVHYSDTTGKDYVTPSNKKSITITEPKQLDVSDSVVPNQKDGLSGGVWFFPAEFTNTGLTTDSYTFSISNLPNGVESVFYLDSNGNGILEATEQEIIGINNVKTGESSKLIIKLTDKIGVPENTIVNLGFVTTSKTDISVKAIGPFGVKITPKYVVTTTPPTAGKCFNLSANTKNCYNVDINNIGFNSDIYNLTLAGLPNGLIGKIYSNKNGNDIIDPEDQEIAKTDIVFGGTKLPVLICIENITNTAPLAAVKPILNVQSITEITVKSSLELCTTLGTPPSSSSSGSGSSSGGSSNPSPIPTPTSTTLIPNLKIQKTGFPNGRVKVGDDLSYSIDVFNDSNVTSKTLYLLDKLPSGLILDEKTVSASDEGIFEYSYDGKNWLDKYPNCIDSKTCIKYIRIKWTKITPKQTFKVFFKTKVDGYVDGAISNVAWAELPDTSFTGKITDVPSKPGVPISESNVTNNFVPNELYVTGTTYTRQGDPRKGIIVELFDKNGKKVGETITGEKGLFSIPVAEKGEYKVVYKLEDGKPMERRFSIDLLGVNYVPIHVSGKVRDSQTQKLITNAKIQLLDENKNLINESETDANGEYTFDTDNKGEKLKAGNYIIAVISASGYVTFIRVTITANQGDVVIAEDLLIDPFGIVYDEFGGEDQRISGAKVEILGDCSTPEKIRTTKITLDKLITGEEQINPYVTGKDGTYQFFLNKDQLTNKEYCLSASANDYYARIFKMKLRPVDFEGIIKVEENGVIVEKKLSRRRYIAEIIDDRGKITVLPNIESIPYRIALKPKKTIILDKKVNRPVIEIGENAIYRVEAQNKFNFTLKDTIMTDLLPKGFKYVEKSLVIEKAENGGNVFKEINLKDLGMDNFKATDRLHLDLGDFPAEQKFRVTYQARAGINVNPGPAVNEVFILGKTKSDATVNEGPAKAVVSVKKGIFNKNGAVVGRVSIDNDPDSKESGLQNIALYTPNGIRVLTDNKGKFSMQDLPSGEFLLHLDKSSLPPNVYLPSEAIEKAEQNNKKIKELVKESVNIDNLSNLLYVSDKPFMFTTNNNKISFNNLFLPQTKKYKMVLTKDIKDKKDEKELPKEQEIDLNHNYLPKDLALNKGSNPFKVKIFEDGVQVKNKKINIWYMPLNFVPKKSTWIGDEDILRRVFIPESGLTKTNFRLTRVEPLVLPDIKIIPDTLKLVYAYPSKFTTKEIPFVTYPDIQNHWAKETIEYESGLEIIHGYPDGQFKPARSITRAEAVKLSLVAMKSFDIRMGTNFTYEIQIPAKVTAKILDENKKEIKVFYENKPRKEGRHILSWDGRDTSGNFRPVGKYYFEITTTDKDENVEQLTTYVEIVPAIGNYHPEGKADFIDMKNHWSSPFVKVAIDEKIAEAFSDKTFRPDAFISRYEMAIMAVKALKLDVSKTSDNLTFEDTEDIPLEARKYVYLATQKDLLPKFPDNKFRPKRPISRAEISILVKNLISEQKIQGLIRGATSKVLNEVIVDEKPFKVNGKVFEIEIDKGSFDLLRISKDADKKVYFDEVFTNKSIFENKSKTSIIPVPEEEITVDDITKMATDTPEGAEAAKLASVKSSFQINLNDTSNKNNYFDVASATVSFTTVNGYESKILINGKEVDSKRIGKRDVNNTTGLKTFTYYGVSLEEGKNTIEGLSIDPNGKVVPNNKISKEVYLKGSPAKFEFLKNKIPADGKTQGNILINVFDKNGIPALNDSSVSVRVEQGEIKSPDMNESESGVQLKVKDGQIKISVIPPNTVMTSKVFVEANGGIKGDGKIEYSTPLRTPILVGTANTNSGYFFAKDAVENNKNTDNPKTGLNFNIGASVFTQGTLFEDYLLTLAFDTRKKLNQNEDQVDSIFRDRTEDRFYPIYGDSSQVTQIVQANSPLYFKLEKEKSNLMWGDFSSASSSENSSIDNSARLALYSRNLTGGKLNLDLPEMLNLNVFGSLESQSYKEEFIRAAGVSGPYFLDKFPLVYGTERISIQVRDRSDLSSGINGKIIDTKQLTKLTDYTINYFDGTIVFTRPISAFEIRKDPQTNQDKQFDVFISVAYEYKSSSKNNVIGGSMSAKLPLGFTVGGSYVTENLNLFNKEIERPYQLMGGNFSQRFSQYFDLMGEYAYSNGYQARLDNKDIFENKAGSAYRVTLLSKLLDNLSFQSEFSKTDENFFNKANGSTVANTQRASAKLDYKPIEKLPISLEYNTDTVYPPSNNKTERAKTQQNARINTNADFYGNNITLSTEWRNTPNSKDDKNNNNSFFASAGYKLPSFNGFSLNINRDQKLYGADEAKSSLTTIGLDIPLYVADLILVTKYNLYDESLAKTKGLEDLFYTRSNWSFGLDKNVVLNKDWSAFNSVNLSSKWQINGAIDGRSAQQLLGTGAKINVTPEVSVSGNYERYFKQNRD